jgi:hypothetical protein
MFKVIMPIKRKSGISRQDFIDAYEWKMVPLIVKLVGNHLVDYKRNYIIKDDPHGFGATDAVKSSVDRLPRREAQANGTADLDVWTELTFKDRRALEEMFAIVNRPAISAEIAALAHQFIDMSSAQRYITEVYPHPET